MAPSRRLAGKWYGRRGVLRGPLWNPGFPRHRRHPSGDGIVVGTGPVDVDAYINFQCPFCKQFELMVAPTLNKLLEDRIISFIRHPMDFLDAVSTTGYSTRAAAAAAAASDAGMFHEYARTLFEYQPPEGGPGLAGNFPCGDGRVVAAPIPS